MEHGGSITLHSSVTCICMCQPQPPLLGHDGREAPEHVPAAVDADDFLEHCGCVGRCGLAAGAVDGAVKRVGMRWCCEAFACKVVVPGVYFEPVQFALLFFSSTSQLFRHR